MPTTRMLYSTHCSLLLQCSAHSLCISVYPDVMRVFLLWTSMSSSLAPRPRRVGIKTSHNNPTLSRSSHLSNINIIHQHASRPRHPYSRRHSYLTLFHRGEYSVLLPSVLCLPRPRPRRVRIKTSTSTTSASSIHSPPRCDQPAHYPLLRYSSTLVPSPG